MLDLTEIEIERKEFKVFTFKEIIADIEKIEGLKLPDGDDQVFAKCLFLRTYSECFPNPVEKGQNHIERRVDKFFGTDEFCVVNPDQAPLEFEYNVYRCVVDPKHPDSFLHTKLVWLNSTNRREALKQYFTGAAKESFFAIVMASNFMINYISKSATK